MAAPQTPYASASLYVGDLAPEVTEALLYEIFNDVGPVASVRVCRDAATRRSLGYAYVNFHRVDDAERALDTMNFKNIREKPCRIMWSHRDPSLRRSGLGNIFVKNLADTIDNKSLYDTFSMFGNILSCKVATNHKGKSLHYGFVHYESDEAAMNAIRRVHGKVIAGKTVTVSAFKSKQERGGGGKQFTNVYVKNIPGDWTQEKLEELFGAHGEITSSKIINDDEKGESKGFGFVNFKDPDQAAAAVEALNGMDLGDEKELFCGPAQKKEQREKLMREKFEAIRAERHKKYAGVNLYVKNLSDDIDDDKLRAEFAKFGSITSTRVMRDSASKSRGFGFVCFSTPEEATKAVTEMNGRMLDGKPLYVALAQRKEVRRAQLEAQYANRKMVQPQMFSPGPGGPPAPMFYQGNMSRNLVYPQHMMPRPGQWGPNQGGPMHVRHSHNGPINYQLMPINRGGGNMGRGGRGGGASGRRGAPAGNKPQQSLQQNQNFKYADNVRNQNQRPAQHNTQNPPMAAVPEPLVAGGPSQKSLTIKALAAAPEEQKKQMIGERLFPLIQAIQPQRAGKITGMLLEMDNTELLHLLESEQALKDKIDEAVAVLNEHADEDAPAEE